MLQWILRRLYDMKLDNQSLVEVKDARAAQQAIGADVRHTPVKFSDSLSARFDADIYLKLDNLQPTGSFKVRGACNAIAQLSEAQKEKGVVTASTGNFGRALAYAGGRYNVPVAVCMSCLVPDNKVHAIKSQGAEVYIHGNSQDEAGEKALALIKERGMKMISPYDDFDVIAGQATLGLELLDDVPDIDIALIPLSGGGLLAGAAMALKLIKPEVQVYGISTKKCPAMVESLHAGHPVDVVENESIADSLGGGIGLDNRYSFEMVKKYVGLSNTRVLSESEILEGMCSLYFEDKVISEGAAAVSVAALLSGAVNDVRGKTIVCHISGENIDMARFTDIITAYKLQK